MNTTKIGLVNYPDRVREYFYEDTHEFNNDEESINRYQHQWQWLKPA